MSRCLIVGADPGASGGIAVLHPDGGVALASKMPATETDLLDLFVSVKTQAVEVYCCVEAVHSFPGNGTASSFKFGMAYGGLRMAILASKIQMETVTPGKWQKALGCLTGGDKKVSYAKAQELFPSLKITHATADALLICEYFRRLWLARNGAVPAGGSAVKGADPLLF